MKGTSSRIAPSRSAAWRGDALEERDLRWASRLRMLHRVLQEAPSAEERERARAALWMSLGVALLACVRKFSSSAHRMSAEDVQDIAWSRTHALMWRAETGNWQALGIDPRELAAYVARVAHNAVIDAVRKRSRESRFVDTDDDSAERILPRGDGPPAGASAESRVERDEFLRALRACLRGIGERPRRVWLLRLFYDMSSREIGRDPRVQMTAPHVDVVLQRVRRALRRGMAARGFDADEPPPGTFARLWQELAAEGLHHPAASADAPT